MSWPNLWEGVLFKLSGLTDHNYSCFHHITFILHRTLVLCKGYKETKFQAFASQATVCKVQGYRTPFCRLGHIYVWWHHKKCMYVCNGSRMMPCKYYAHDFNYHSHICFVVSIVNTASRWILSLVMNTVNSVAPLYGQHTVILWWKQYLPEYCFAVDTYHFMATAVTTW